MPMAMSKRKAQLEKEREVMRAMCQRSLLAYVLAHNPKFKTPRHIRALADALEAVERGEIKRLQVFMPPQNGKSTLSSEYFASWFLGKHPDRRLAYGSYNGDFATERGRKVRNLLDGAVHLDVFPAGGLSGDSTAASAFAMEGGGGFKAVGRGQGLTGFAVNGIIIDDPLKDMIEADSSTIRAELRDWYNTVIKTRLKPDDFLIIINTRWHVDDLSGYTLKYHAYENWKVLNFPAISPEGEALWPEQFPLDFLLGIKSGMPPRQWSALYQQNPVSEDGGLLNPAHLLRYTPRMVDGMFRPPVDGAPDYIVQSWDTAQKEKELSDPSVCTTWWVYGKKAYLVDVFLKRLKFGPLKEAVIAQAELHRPTLILVEDKASGIQLLQELDNVPGLPLRGIEPDGNKVLRASRTSTVIYNGDIYIPDDGSTPWVRDYELEMATFPAGDHDDQVDSTSQFLDWLMTLTRSLLIWCKTPGTGRAVRKTLQGY